MHEGKSLGLYFVDRNDPEETGKPFFVGYDPARMHITTVLDGKDLDMTGVEAGKAWGVNEAARSRWTTT